MPALKAIMGTIVQLFRRRQPDSFEDLLAPHIEHLYRLAYRFTGQRDEAEDLVQDLLLKLYPRRHELEHIEALRAWLSRTLYHHFIDTVRRAGRSPLHDATSDVTLLQEIEADTATPEEEVETLQLQRRLTRAMAELNPDQRALVNLHDVEGYTLVELQTLLDTPLGTLKSRLHRARARLRELLEMEPFTEQRRLSE